MVPPFAGMVLLLVGLAGVLGGGTTLAVTVSYLDGCVTDCHPAALSGAVGAVVLAAGVICLLVGAVRLASEREGRKVAARAWSADQRGQPR